VGNLWRTTDDIGDNWASMLSNLDQSAQHSTVARPGAWNDPDMLEIGNGGMTADEYRTQMSLWSILPAPLLAGNDQRTMDAVTKEILLNREVIAVDQDPAGTPARRLERRGEVEVLVRDMSDGSIVVGFFNRGEQTAKVDLDWRRLGDRFGQGATARDLWRRTAVAPGRAFTGSVPRHGVVLLRVSPAA
jgi:alpha-galactosidase